MSDSEKLKVMVDAANQIVAMLNRAHQGPGDVFQKRLNGEQAARNQLMVALTKINSCEQGEQSNG